jgi:hypothetical protein
MRATALKFAAFALAVGFAGCSDDVTQGPSASNLGADDAGGDGLAMDDATGDAAEDAAATPTDATVADTSGATPTDAADSELPPAADGVAALDAVDAAPAPDVPPAGDAAVGADASAPVDAVVGSDVVVPVPVCGNGYCENGENPGNCGADCKGLSWSCGDGVCDIGEQFYCQNDCVDPVCGDGKCEAGEQSQGCVKDCGTSTTCGDNICGAGENGTNCAKDCGIGTWQCGDGKCDFGEQFYCFKDCQAGPTNAVSCLQSNCGSDYKNCSASPACNSALQCMIGCKGSYSCLQGCVNAAGGSGSMAVQTAICGQQNGCL